MKKKRVLTVSTLVLLVMLWMGPIQAEAFCEPWGEVLKKTSYCATPVCYTGNRTYFVEHNYKRICCEGLWDITTEYKIEKVDNGCCPYN